MIGRYTRVVSIVGVIVLALVWTGDLPYGQTAVRAQVSASTGKPAASFNGLTPLDYIEIRQLVARYAYAVDTGADKGNTYASLFTPDGAFADRTGRETTGREALAALARRNTRGPQSAFHFIVNHVIEPTKDGTVGKEYLLQLRIGDGERPNDVFGGGHYDDVYVKTPQGWRFKSRSYFESTSGAPVQPPPATLNTPRALTAPSRAVASGSTTRLTAEDYIEIQQLVARYPYALGQNGDEGASYANLFTADGVFRQPRTEGRPNLATMASRAPRGPNYTRHFLTNHASRQRLTVQQAGSTSWP